ncbi:MAG: hypothetical protein P9M03_01945 [Candidatus Theseobacter exili]|nr:hypothetical protein [Candidatus Theseobacter exili]
MNNIIIVKFEAAFCLTMFLCTILFIGSGCASGPSTVSETVCENGVVTGREVVAYDGKGGQKKLYKCGVLPQDDETGAEAIENGADNPFTSSPEYQENDMGAGI